MLSAAGPPLTLAPSQAVSGAGPPGPEAATGLACGGQERKPACGATVNVRTSTWLMLPRSITEASTRRPGAETSMRRAHAAAVGSADPRDSDQPAHATRISRPTRLGSADPRDSDRPNLTKPTEISNRGVLAASQRAWQGCSLRGAWARVLAAWQGADCMAPGSPSALHPKRNRVITHGAWASVCTAPQTKQSDHAWRLGVRLYCTPNPKQSDHARRPSALHPGNSAP